MTENLVKEDQIVHSLCMVLCVIRICRNLHDNLHASLLHTLHHFDGEWIRIMIRTNVDKVDM